jgi:hypothetical protein
LELPSDSPVSVDAVGAMVLGITNLLDQMGTRGEYLKEKISTVEKRLLLDLQLSICPIFDSPMVG